LPEELTDANYSDWDEDDILNGEKIDKGINFGYAKDEKIFRTLT
jgi:hypothetical protein